MTHYVALTYKYAYVHPLLFLAVLVAPTAPSLANLPAYHLPPQFLSNRLTIATTSTATALWLTTAISMMMNFTNSYSLILRMTKVERLSTLPF